MFDFSIHSGTRFINWLISFAKVRVLIGLPINPLLVISFISSLPPAITDAVTKTTGISRVALSRRNILSGFRPAHIREAHIHNDDIRLFLPGNRNSGGEHFQLQILRSQRSSRRSFSSIRLFALSSTTNTFFLIFHSILAGYNRQSKPGPMCLYPVPHLTATQKTCRRAAQPVFWTSGRPSPVPSVTRE